MLYVPCAEKREITALLSTPIVSLKSVSGLSNQVHVYTNLVRPYNALSILKSLGRFGRDCDFERQMRTARLPSFAGLHNVGMISVPPSRLGPLYASVSGWWSGYKRHRK